MVLQSFTQSYLKKRCSLSLKTKANLCFMVGASSSIKITAKINTKTFVTTPEKFNNKTNGIAHRRWLISSNTELSDLITGLISEDWKTDTRKLKELEAHRHDKAVLEKIGQIKYNNDSWKQSIDETFNAKTTTSYMYKRKI